jgi:hypothetical protein
LYYVFRDSLHTELAIKRTFRMAFFPLATVCLLSAVSLWPNVTAVMGIVVYGHLFHRFHQTGLRAGLPRMGEG